MDSRNWGNRILLAGRGTTGKVEAPTGHREGNPSKEKEDEEEEEKRGG